MNYVSLYHHFYLTKFKNSFIVLIKPAFGSKHSGLLIFPSFFFIDNSIIFFTYYFGNSLNPIMDPNSPPNMHPFVSVSPPI